MAEGGSAPLRDPGGLHVYSVNGTGHKLAELIPESPGPHATSMTAMYTDMSPGLSPSFTIESSMSQSGGYMQGEGFGDGGMYTEMKRPSPHGQSVFSFTNLDSLHQHQHQQPLQHHQQQQQQQQHQNHVIGTMFDHLGNSFSSSQDITSSLSGYVDMLSGSDPLINIKREKPDYSETLPAGMVHNQNSPDIPYPPNTCVPDWNFYNPTSGGGHFPGQGTQPGFEFPSQLNQQQYTNHMMFTNTHPHTGTPQFQTNDDIHQKAMKISQNILSTEWGNNIQYKSNVYQNLAADPVVRKRRPEESKLKMSRAKRKKSNVLGGHSKSVASILMSENSSSSASNGSRSPDGLLDSAARNHLVGSLMDNIRSTVQFESFCLSFPRSDMKENAFRQKVCSTASMVNNIENENVTPQVFPSQFLIGANKVITNFKNALENTRSRSVDTENGGSESSANINLRNEQVEEHLPHSMVWVIRMGDKTLTANWEGQFVVGVNPVQKTMSCSIFQFQPSFSAEGIKCLQQSKLTKELASDILSNMEQFEVSRQLRCDINLEDVTQLYLYKPTGDDGEGCLLLETGSKPTFYQKWLHTSAYDKNKWRQRENFFSKSDVSDNQVVCIGGLVSELNELMALILASDHDLEQRYENGVEMSIKYNHSNNPKNHMNVNGESKSEKSKEGKSSIRQKRVGRKLGSNLQKLRKEIIAVLAHHAIVHESEMTLVINSQKLDKEEISSGVSLGITVEDGVWRCLQDFVNYSCDSATELNSILEKEIQPRAYGFYENDFDMLKVPGGNIDRLRLGEFIASRCSEVVYYSFCKNEVGQLGYDQHCPQCHVCRTIHFWHCDSCDQCTQTRSVCEFCGHLRNDQTQIIIKPMSVFKSQVSLAGIVTSGDIKKEWISSLSQPDDDLLTLDLPKLDMANAELGEYNSQNAMVDQLGLLNPVGFLLGQPQCGASRKHRRYRGGQVNDILPNSKQGQRKETGCCIQ